MSSFGNAYGINLPGVYGAAMQAKEFQQQQQAKTALLKYAPDILSTDPSRQQSGFESLAAVDPQSAIELQGVTAKRQQALDAMKQEHFEKAGQVFGAIANLPDNQIGPAAQQALAQAKADGADTSQIEPIIASGDPAKIRQAATLASRFAMTQAQQLSQSNADRTYQAGRSDHADLLKYQNRSLAIQQQKVAQGDASSLTPEASDMLGTIALTNGGNVPSFGMGGGKQKAAIFNNMASKANAQGISGEDIATGAASFKANSQALGQITKMQTAIGSYEQTASQNADVALGLMQKGAGPTGSPVVDRWIRAGGKSIAGDADVSKFDTALNTFKNEYAKVMSGGYGAAGTSDSMRHEADGLISPNMSREQILGNIQVMKQDMANRTKALNDYRSNLVQHIHSGTSSIYQPVTGTQPQQQPQGGSGAVIRYDAQGNRIQ